MAGMTQSDDIMSAYDMLASTPDGGSGILPSELAEQHGIGMKRARDIIRALIAAGQVEHATRRVQRINGTWQRVVSYKLVSND